jgi:hypothetical protein
MHNPKRFAAYLNVGRQASNHQQNDAAKMSDEAKRWFNTHPSLPDTSHLLQNLPK